MAEGSANCAAINLTFNFFRQHVIRWASRKGAGGGTLPTKLCKYPRPMALNLAMLNDYRTCKCTSYTIHRHTAPVVYQYYYIPCNGSAIQNNSFLRATQLILFNSWKALSCILPPVLSLLRILPRIPHGARFRSMINSISANHKSP